MTGQRHFMEYDLLILVIPVSAFSHMTVSGQSNIMINDYKDTNNVFECREITGKSLIKSLIFSGHRYLHVDVLRARVNAQS